MSFPRVVDVRIFARDLSVGLLLPVISSCSLDIFYVHAFLPMCIQCSPATVTFMLKLIDLAVQLLIDQIILERRILSISLLS